MKNLIKTALGKYGAIKASKLLVCIVPIIFVLIPCYLLANKKNKDKLKQDIKRNWEVEDLFHSTNNISKLIILLSSSKPFRTIFYLRTAPYSIFIKWIMPGISTFNMATPSNKIGGGLYIQHGTATGINAKCVGNNLWINQRASIGWTDKGNPTIGDNVTIGVGAVVLGPITIGNNVKIGANAIVVDDIPDNVTVCSPKAKIIKHNS